MRVLIITYPVPKDIKTIIDIKNDDYIIGVDQAIAYVLEQKIRCDLAVGDFDSLKDQSILETLKIEKLSPIKDVTDTDYALDKAISLKPDDIVIIGGMGGERIEHFYAHLLLFDKCPRLKMINAYTKITRLDFGLHQIEHQGYISLFAYPETILTLRGFRYPLEKYHLKTFDPLGISNELIDKKGIIEVHKGSLLVFESKRT